MELWRKIKKFKGYNEMKLYFIVNPMSGQGKAYRTIEKLLEDVSFEYEIYLTTAPLDATRFVKEKCEEFAGETVRFIACGGDGTLNEVANGAVGYDNAEVGCCPCGSGNDFVKYYGGADCFMDVKALAENPVQKIDLIKVGDKYSINVVHFGFDTCVLRTMLKVKRMKLIGGKNAYNTGVISAVLTGMKNKGKLYADGELLNEDGRFLLCTAANCSHIGGKFYCAPRAENNDGFIDVCAVKPISRFKLMNLINSYEKGEHLDDPKFAPLITYRRCKTFSVEAPEGFCISIDGELTPLNKFTCEIVPSAISFVVPAVRTENKKAETAEATL